MADKYSTVQQREPLRVPEGWSGQEKHLIVQLEEIFDDIYRRYGRLRIEDMGKAFRKRIEDDEDNFAELAIDVGEITIEVGNKYDKVSGITIDSNGIDISGSKYVKIRSGGSFDVDSLDFSIDSTNKKLRIGDWTLDTNGLQCAENSTAFGKVFLGIGKNSISSASGYPCVSFRMLADNSTTVGEYETAIIHIQDTGNHYSRLHIQKYSDGILLMSDTDSDYTAQIKVKNLCFDTNAPLNNDLNNATQQGIYAVPGSSGQHLPSDYTPGFAVLCVNVQYPGHSTSEHIVQTFYTPGAMYVRHKVRPNQAWTSWYKFTGTAV